MLLLAVTTSTPRGGAAVLEGDRLLGEAAYVDLEGHAERIFAAMDEALRAAGVRKGSLQALACDVGPGSFTGVRVGVAAVKGAAMALGVPVAGVGSLEAMAAAVFGLGHAAGDDVVAALLDARRGELFVGAYDASLDSVVEPFHERRELALDLLAARAPPRAVEGRLVLVGEAAAELERPPIGLVRLPSLDSPDPAWVGRRALCALAGAGLDAAEVEPRYVRAPDARPATIPARSKAD